MEQIEVIPKKWGNSLGVILPSMTVEREGLKEGKKITLTISSKSSMTVGEIMEFARRLGISNKLKKIDTEKILKEADKALWPD